MKKTFFISALITFSFIVKAQDAPSITGFKFGAGASVAIPVSNLDFTSIGAGIDLLGQYGINENIAITADAGYTGLFGKKGYSDFTLIPIRAGVRYFATPELYFAGKIGVGILKTKGLSSETSTAYSFGAGYFISSNVDVSAAYDGYSKNGSIGLVAIRLGYTFGN